MMRVGCGFDVHPLVAGRRLLLGGVVIEHTHGFAGHSDADVLTHAVIDALLGALALGDIGQHFPDDDETYRDADSMVLLRETVQKIKAQGAGVVNVDATIALQYPKLRNFIPAMRENLAAAMAVSVGQVSVKATTTERLGFVGRQEGAAVYAVALLQTGATQ